MSYRVIQIKGDENPNSGQLRLVHEVGRFDTKDAALARQRELGDEKRRIYEDRNLPGEVRKRAMETDYAVWSDQDVEDAKRLGTSVN